MFQVNGHSLVGASHRYAVQILKSSGDDIVTVVNRPQTSRDNGDQPSLASSHERHTASSQPLRTNNASVTNAQQLQSNLPEPLAICTKCKAGSSVKVGDQQSPEKRYGSRESLSVVEGRTASCSVNEEASSSSQSSGRGSQPRTLSFTRPSSTAQQEDRNDAVSLQGSRLQDQVKCVAETLRCTHEYTRVHNLPDYLNDSHLSTDIFKHYIKTYVFTCINYTTR